MELRIESPIWLLFLILPVIYFTFAWWKNKKQQSREYTVIFIIRVVAVLLLIFALAGPTLLLPIKEEQILFVVDRSASTAGTESQSSEFLSEAFASKKDHQAVGIYSFDKSFQTQMPLSLSTEYVPEFTGTGDSSQTNISESIQLASNLADQQKATRIVLLSDGLENSGSVSDQISRMAGSHVEIDTYVLNRPQSDDVAITGFETPPVAFEGEQQQLIVQVESTKAVSGELILSQNDEFVSKQAVQIEPGSNTFTLRHASTGEGLLKYQVQLNVIDDALLENNQLTSVTMVESAPRLLVVSGDTLTSPVPTYIDQNVIQTDTISASDLPFDLSNYLAYDAIIFDNVPGYQVGEAKMTVIEQAVKNFGVGFMMVGGDNSYGLGGYFKTPVEKLLPVEMEVKGKQQLPSLGLIIVMDRSGSMAGNKFELAKEAAARSIDLLREDDTLGFIAFDDRPWEIIEAKTLTNKEEALEKILSVSVGGGTEIYPGLELAYERLTELKLQRKHIILLTDGQSASQNDYETLITDGLGSNITLSTVAIGQDSDRALLEELAQIGTGRFYDVMDESTIPAILSRETVMISRTYIEDNPFYPTISGDAAWTSLFTEGVPQFNAYIATTAKQTATVIAQSTKEDPVIAEWMYGLGRTIAYTSDSTGAWSGDFARFSQWGNFWNTAVSRLLPSYSEVPFDIRKSEDGSFVVSDPSGQSSFLDIVAVNEAGEDIASLSEPIAPGKSRVSFDADPGLIFLRISNEQNSMYQAGVSIPYSDEYKIQPPNNGLMQDIADRTDGQVLDSPEQAMRDIVYQSAESKSIQKWLVLLAMLLFFIDITLRRFGWRLLSRLPQTLKPSTPELVSTESDTNVARLLKGKKKR
ncbi:VWA domain-containing protein [Paenisporosarcina indica]|uniref:VWA domain-containing protein n=1 Tax=Paenisporosarcina indica TaxID=650093 RepID=UPI00094FC48E|nr:VWA domain-containing protein [Paenisporosarcina indica]